MATSFQRRMRRKRALAEEFRSSGLTRLAFCRLKKIPLSTLDWWLQRTRNEKQTALALSPGPVGAKGPPLFIPLSINSPGPLMDRFELHFTDGRKLLFPPGIAMDDVVRLIRESALVS